MAINEISKHQFDQFGVERGGVLPFIAEEKAWFADSESNLLGVVLFERGDKDWTFIVLGRDDEGQFRTIAVDVAIPTQDEAESKLREKMGELLKSADIRP